MYYKYSEYLKNKYGEKTYKLPVNINCTCPNRDGKISTSGCYFCSEVGTGFESHSCDISVKEQLDKNRIYIEEKYHAKKFIAYFQNYTNTYIDIDLFKKYMNDAALDYIVEIVVSTRPDCIEKEHLDILSEIRQKYNIEIGIELGLQSANDETLEKINRGHTVQDFIGAVKLIKSYDMEVCCHFILNLPYDCMDDKIKGANLMNELNVDHVKIHSLYIPTGSVFEKMYNAGKLKIGTKESYVESVAVFLAHLNRRISVQRLVARAPKEHTVFCNWDTSWWKIQDEILNYMSEYHLVQGKLC